MEANASHRRECALYPFTSLYQTCYFIVVIVVVVVEKGRVAFLIDNLLTSFFQPKILFTNLGIAVTGSPA